MEYDNNYFIIASRAYSLHWMRRSPYRHRRRRPTAEGGSGMSPWLFFLLPRWFSSSHASAHSICSSSRIHRLDGCHGCRLHLFCWSSQALDDYCAGLKQINTSPIDQSFPHVGAVRKRPHMPVGGECAEEDMVFFGMERGFTEGLIDLRLAPLRRVALPHRRIC
jgi:hypothetical protein